MHCLITWKFFTIANGCIAPWAIKRRRTLKVLTTDSNCMTLLANLVDRVGPAGFLKLTTIAKNSPSFCLAKQRRALLESNPPRDSWIERRRNNTVSTFGEAQTSPKAKGETIISEPEHALE